MGDSNMLKQRLAAAHAVRQLLIETEEGIENIMATTAQRTVALLKARAVAGLPITAGQGAFERNAALLQTLITARRQAGVEHAELAEAVRMMGLTAYGDQFECPKENGGLKEFPTPRLVA